LPHIITDSVATIDLLDHGSGILGVVVVVVLIAAVVVVVVVVVMMMVVGGGEGGGGEGDIRTGSAFYPPMTT